jgi:hypothetical protein
MTVDGTVTPLLIVSRDAKRMTPPVQHKLDAAFPRYALGLHSWANARRVRMPKS